MTAPKEPGTGFLLFAMILCLGSGGAFEAILYFVFGWQIAALPVLAFLCVLGYRAAWVPADGNAGTRGNDAGAGYVIRLDPDDPDAGVPRRGA